MSNEFPTNMQSIGAIILAAGKGKRMRVKEQNKVTLPLGNKPMIMHAVSLLKEISIKPIVIVVGFAKHSVINLLNADVIYAEQKKRLGTGHAVKCALEKLPLFVRDVIVIGGDDSAFYTKEIFKKLLRKHKQERAVITFLTLEHDDPYGLGRVVRNKDGEVVAIIEEKDATNTQRKITEINPACYVFSADFLRKYISAIPKSSVTGEYYLVSLIGIAAKHKEKIVTYQGGNMPWRGVNTQAELEEAQKLFINLHK